MVVSANYLQDVEDGMFYAILISSKNHNPDLTIEIKNEWLNKPLSKQSYFVTHIVAMFNTEDVVNRYNNYVKSKYFDSILEQAIQNLFYS